MQRRKHVVFSLLILFMGLLLAWRILVTGLGDHYTRKARLGDAQAVDSALLWNGNQPRALYLKGRLLMETDPQKAIDLLRRAIVLNPGDAEPMQVLANLLLQSGKPDQADSLMVLAIERMPANKDVRFRAADYWMARGDLDKAVQNWAAVLELDSDQGKRIYPLLANLAENPATRGVLNRLLQSPPSWWNGFFAYLAKHAERLETVVRIATLRHASKTPLSDEERAMLVERLQKEQQWPEAYLVWINGLSQKQRRYLGSVFDGGFELPPGNGGFFWYFPEHKSLIVRRKHTYGGEGEKSLHILYRGQPTPRQQVYQYLLLGKGRYVLQLRQRVDRLRISGGLRWVVRCAGENDRLLGAVLPLVGASDWEMQQATFEVPDAADCRGQVLRLEISDGGDEYPLVEGEVWFDRISIRKMS
ncbi:tetratricopeptide repeat protein [Thiolapillus sp.]